MRKILILATLIAAPAFAQQQEQLLPGEADDRLAVAFETITQQASGLIVNPAKVRAQKREIDRLAAEVKGLREKCGTICESKKPEEERPPERLGTLRSSQ